MTIIKAAAHGSCAVVSSIYLRSSGLHTDFGWLLQKLLEQKDSYSLSAVISTLEPPLAGKAVRNLQYKIDYLVKLSSVCSTLMKIKIKKSCVNNANNRTSAAKLMLGWFLRKAIHRLFGSNLVLNEIKGKPEANCRLCKKKKEEKKKLKAKASQKLNLHSSLMQVHHPIESTNLRSSITAAFTSSTNSKDTIHSVHSRHC